MNKVSLEAVCREQASRAATGSSGRSAQTVYGGHANVLRQTVIALASGSVLAEHESPGEATVHVLHGRVRLRAGSSSWEGRRGDLIAVPGVRHTLEALEAPFALPSALVGLVFLGYLAGTWASTAAGRLGDRVGRRRVLWGAVLAGLAGAWVTVPDLLPTVLGGVLLMTVGFFAAHSVASSWVGRRAALLPGGAPGQASSLYLFAYYAGSSAGGALGGVAYDLAGWTGLVAYVTALLLGALGLALALRRIPSP